MNLKLKKVDCPECLLPMRQQHRNGVEIDQCGNCFGIFFDYGELEQFAQQQKKAKIHSVNSFKAAHSKQLLHCPKCQSATMEQGEQKGVHVSVCQNCQGIYLPCRSHQKIFTLPDKKRSQRANSSSSTDGNMGSWIIGEVMFEALLGFFN